MNRKIEKSKILLTGVLFLIFYTLGLGYVITFRLLSAIGDFFNVGPSESGLFVLLPGISMVLSLLVGGYVSDKISKGMVLTWGLVFFTLGFLGVGLGKMSLAICLISVFISGLGFGLIQSSGNAFIFTMYPERRVFLSNWLHLFLVAGASSAPWLAGSFIQRGRWYLSYTVAAALSLLSLILFRLINSRFVIQREKMDFGVVKQVFSNRLFQFFCLGIFLYGSSERGIGSWMSSFVEKEKSFSISEANLALSLYWVMMVPSRVAISWLSLRIDVNRFLLGCALVSLIGIGISIFAKSHLSIIAGFILTGLSFGPLFPTLLGLGAGSVGQYAGLVSGIIISSGTIGGSLFPYLMGVVSEHMNFHMGILLGSLPIICLILLLGYMVNGKLD